MKLSQGEYVALEKIESTYGTVPAVAQVFVHGDSLQAFLLAVVVPDPIQLSSIVAEVTGTTVSATDEAGLRKACADERVNKYFLKLLTKTGKQKGLKGFVAIHPFPTLFTFNSPPPSSFNRFEMVKRIHLNLDPFTEAENTLTPTMKLRRKDAYAKFKTELDGLYAVGDQDLSKL